MQVKGYDVKRLAGSTFKEAMKDRVPALAAESAYYLFFSIFPLFLFLAPLVGVIGDPHENFEWLFTQLARAVPGEALGLVREVVEQVVFAPGAPGLLSFGLVLALWSGSNIFSSLMDTLNQAFDARETRPWWKAKLIAIAAVVVAAVGLIFATIVLVGGGDIVNAVADRIGIGPAGRVIWIVLQTMLALGILVAIAWGQYRFLPNARVTSKHALAGAIVATLLWVIVTLGFRFYVQNFGSYNKTYGTIGGVIVLLTWMYLSMLVLLLGGEMTAELEKGTALAAAPPDRRTNDERRQAVDRRGLGRDWRRRGGRIRRPNPAGAALAVTLVAAKTLFGGKKAPRR